jgi:ankyrin repeat protein
MVGCGHRAGGVDLWEAVRAQKVEDIRRYAEHGGTVDGMNFGGLTPLMYALENNLPSSYEELLKHGADPNIPTRDGRTVTAWAAMKKDDTTWLRLALEDGADPNLVSKSRASKFKRPPLRFATTTGSLGHAKLLVDHGADVNFLGPTQQRPLICAAGSGRYDVVLLLLEAGADFNAKDTKPFSFLDAVQRIRSNRELQLHMPEMRQQFEKVEAWLEENGVNLDN